MDEISSVYLLAPQRCVDALAHIIQGGLCDTDLLCRGVLQEGEAIFRYRTSADRRAANSVVAHLSCDFSDRRVRPYPFRMCRHEVSRQYGAVRTRLRLTLCHVWIPSSAERQKLAAAADMVPHSENYQ